MNSTSIWQDTRVHGADNCVKDGEDGRNTGVEHVLRELQQEHVGRYFQSAARVHVPESSERCRSCQILGGEVKKPHCENFT